MNKYESFILDKRELQGAKKRMAYWQKFMFLPAEELQSVLYTPELYSKNKSERKESRKRFIRKVTSHSQENAYDKHKKLLLRMGELSESTMIRIKEFDFFEKTKIYWMEVNPRSTVNSPSWHAVQWGEAIKKAFMEESDIGANVILKPWCGIDMATQPDSTAYYKRRQQ